MQSVLEKPEEGEEGIKVISSDFLFNRKVLLS
jgi:hypothetical protein